MGFLASLTASEHRDTGRLHNMNTVPWWVYVVELFSIHGLYVGITTNLYSRLKQHASGEGSLITQEFGVLRVLHMEWHWGMQVVQHRENEATRHYVGKGIFAFGGGGSVLIPTESKAQRNLRDCSSLVPMPVGKRTPFWWQMAPGKRRLPFPAWHVQPQVNDSPVERMDGYMQVDLL